MPELPEVETTKQGIKPHLEGRMITAVQVRNRKLRLPVPLNLNELCQGKHITAITRRGKYILLHMDKGYLLIHLGMSGHLRIVSQTANPQKHDHVDLHINNGLALRFCDPRRFGLFIYIDENPYQHPLLAHLYRNLCLMTLIASTYYVKLRINRNPSSHLLWIVKLLSG